MGITTLVPSYSLSVIFSDFFPDFFFKIIQGLKATIMKSTLCLLVVLSLILATSSAHEHEHGHEPNAASNQSGHASGADPISPLASFFAMIALTFVLLF